MSLSFRVGKGKGSGNQFMARGLLNGISSVIRQELINLFSYIKKTATSCSNIIRADSIESSIIKTYELSGFIKKEINVISKIDRVEVTI